MKTKCRSKLLGILFAFVMAIALLLVPTVGQTALADEPEITTVSTWRELLNAVNSDKTHIKLMNDIENVVPGDEIPTSHRLVFDGGKDYVLDLNGNRLMVGNYDNEFYSGNFSMIAVSNSSNLQIEYGRITFENWYSGSERTSKGVVSVTDESTLTAKNVVMYNAYTGTVVYARDNAAVTLDGGDYTVMNGFALYLEGQASLTLNKGVYIGTKMGDSTSTVYVDGYGALYSASTGTLTVNNAYFNTGIQVHETQVDAFSTTTHELVLNGEKQLEDVYYSDAGSQFSALNANKTYYWYKNGYSRALYKVETTGFANTASVISYEKKYAISVDNGVAMVDDVPVTEVGYGQEVTIVANEPEAGMEFVRWDTSGVELADYYSTTTTFTMPAAPVYLAAYYGNESIKSVNVTVGDIVVGEKAYDTEITLDGDVTLATVEWYENLIKMGENDIFKPGRTYEIKILVYPPNEYKFSETATVTLNGKNATASVTTQYATISYTFDTLAENPFPVVYNTETAQLGIGGKLELNTTLMCEQSAEFKTAFEAGTVAYQWYKDSEAIEGATESVYNFTAEDNGSKFYVTVTVGDKTAWGDMHNCYNHLYQIYLNATEIISGGKAPLLTSATPGVSIDAESLIICEDYAQPALDIQKTMLIPGETYIIIGKLVQSGEANIPNGANVYVNGDLMDDQVDALYKFFYKFTVPGEMDYPVYYKTNGAVGIGVTLTVDTQKMCDESGTFKNAYEAANSTYQTVFYQWYKDGKEIVGATDISYTVKSSDKNSYINCKVTLVDGKCGFGAQQIITNVITVFNVKMSYPKGGEKRITSASVDGATASIMWWPKETGTEMNGDDRYVEGTVYEFCILFSPKDTFAFADAAERTVYVYGEQATHNSGYVYMGEIAAIHAHQYSDSVWNYDEYSHWQPCIVPGCPNPNEDYEGNVFHWGGGATCHTSGICSECGAEYYTEHDFGSGYYVYVDEMTCARKCAFEGCNETVDWSYHEGGVATCQQKAVCEICHTEYGEFVECMGGTATCTEKAVCATCGEEYGDFAKHPFGSNWDYKDVNGHAHKCTANGCEAHDDIQAHTPDKAQATETEAVRCVDCGYIITPALGHVTHTPKDVWTTNATHHWHDCVGCEGQEIDKATHKDEDSNGLCDVCEYQLPISNGGNGNETPDIPDEPKGGLSTGAIVGIAVGGVAVVGLGGFALVWFVVKKKTWAEFLAIFKKK